MPLAAEDLLAQWDVSLDSEGVLTVGGLGTIELANRFGTPLHVVNRSRLTSTAASFVRAFRENYPGRTEVYFAVKSNPVGGVVKAITAAGAGVEVFTPYELRLARLAGCSGDRTIVNGPAKTPEFLRECVDASVRLIVADSRAEVERIAEIARERRASVSVLLRARIDYVPAGISPGSATASRNSVFGMDEDELIAAVRVCQASPSVPFRGLHMHIGSAIRRADAYREACRRLCRIALHVKDETGAAPDYLDVGGGFGTPMVREFSSLDFLLYHGLSRPPAGARPDEVPSFADFAKAIAAPIATAFAAKGLPIPVLALEPGRCLVSSSQILLLRVRAIKRKPGRRGYVLTDGGQMNVNFPTFYENHDILCCREPFRKPAAVDIVGSGCHSADFVLRNASLPPVTEGDVIAVMDAGAYFISFEGNFSFPRPAVVSVANGSARLLRRAETCEDMLRREQLDVESAGT